MNEWASFSRDLIEQWPLIASGAFRPIIDKTFPLRQAAEAHAYLEAGDHLGKVMLTV